MNWSSSSHINKLWELWISKLSIASGNPTGSYWFYQGFCMWQNSPLPVVTTMMSTWPWSSYHVTCYYATGSSLLHTNTTSCEYLSINNVIPGLRGTWEASCCADTLVKCNITAKGCPGVKTPRKVILITWTWRWNEWDVWPKDPGQQRLGIGKNLCEWDG